MGHEKVQDAAMPITKKTVADRIAAYLHHEITVAQLVEWAENAMMDGEFFECDAAALSSVFARLGVADVRAFGLAWEDREELLHKVWGYARDLEIETRTVDIHIAKLRRKLEPDAKQPKHLITVRGGGYRLVRSAG